MRRPLRGGWRRTCSGPRPRCSSASATSFYLHGDAPPAAAMSNSQEQSLDDSVVFLQVSEASPAFLHCEREREAVERLLAEGPEAFYTSTGRSGCFLSPEEVGQITGWARGYCSGPPQAPQENGADGLHDDDDFCSTYFPCETDMPTPHLELGWPDRDPRLLPGNVTVHSGPPPEGEPAVREIIRRHLQRASQLIAVATDRLTDGVIISDLHHAASRGVPIYIILNQRSTQENFTLNRLGHPNMRVRILGGKRFCTRTGRVVVGEMKTKFLLVDLDTVIYGSYSLTWTDAHLHRQLVTVLTGPVVDAFDREFRILYAASTPATEKWSIVGSRSSVSHQLKDFPDGGFQEAVPVEPEVAGPPSPPSDCVLDWEAMGVIPREGGGFFDGPLDRHEDGSVSQDQIRPVLEGFTSREDEGVERTRSYENSSPRSAAAPQTASRVEQRIKMAVMTQVSNEQNHHEGSATRLDAKPNEPPHLFLSALRRARWRKEPVPEEGGGSEESEVMVESSPSSREPVLQRSCSSLSDAMRRIQLRTRSAVDPGRPGPDAPPRFQGSFDVDPMTPALALMKKRNDNVKSSLFGHQQTFLAGERPRSSSYALKLDWRRSLSGGVAEQD